MNEYYRPTFDFTSRTTSSTIYASTTGSQTITSINGYEPIRIEYEPYEPIAIEHRPTTVYNEITWADMLQGWKDLGITVFHAEDADLEIDAEQLSKDIEKIFEEGSDE